MVWLDGEQGTGPQAVGPRAAVLGRLRRAKLAVPRSFALGRDAYEQFAAASASEPALPADLVNRLTKAVRTLGAPIAVRRMPLYEGEEAAPRPRPGRAAAERESYLHLLDAADVFEAVRRLFWRAVRQRPSAVLVQRFVAPRAAAVIRPEDAGGALCVESCLGCGDLLAHGLVVPDRHLVARETGAVLSRRIGRKAQMTVPSPDGGLRRVPVPSVDARQPALDDATLGDLAALWRSAEESAGPLASLSVAITGKKRVVMTAVPKAQPAAVDDGVMLG